MKKKKKNAEHGSPFHIQSNRRIGPQKPVQATSAYSPEKYGIGPIGCRLKEFHVLRRHKQLRRFVLLLAQALFESVPLK
jgi:hypothetical protein